MDQDAGKPHICDEGASLPFFPSTKDEEACCTLQAPARGVAICGRGLGYSSGSP